MKLSMKIGQSILAVLLVLTVAFVFPGALTANPIEDELQRLTGEEDAFQLEKGIPDNIMIPLADEPVWGVPVTVASLAGLRTAIASTPDNVPTVIEIFIDILIDDGNGSIDIPANKIIKLTINDVTPWKIDANGGDFSVITNDGELWLEGIIITGSGISGNGGGVYNSGYLYLRSSEITGNVVLDGSGGGVYNTGLFTMLGGSITNNSAEYYGGGVYNFGNDSLGAITTSFEMTDGLIAENLADGGGGVFNDASTHDAVFSMQGGTIYNNQAMRSGNSSGGGVFNYSEDGDAVFTFGAGWIMDNTAYFQGGGVWNNGEFSISEGIITGNDAEEGGGVFCDDDFTMTGGEVSDNTADLGGGIFVVGSFAMTGGEISGNGVDTSSAVVTVNGGGVFVRGAVFLSGGTITSNSAIEDGGGIYGASGPAFVVSSEAVITDNYAGSVGGGIYATGYDTVDVEGGLVTNNQANNGGGIYSESAIIMSGGQILANETFLVLGDGGNGGGLYAYHFELSGGVVDYNKAEGNGGGAYIVGDDSFLMSGGEISNNGAVNGGGVYGLWFVPMEITAGTISGNTAFADGGGIWIENLANITVGTGVLFADNLAFRAVKDLSNLYMPAGVTWTLPFQYGNNNYDINYTGDQPYFVFVENSFAAVTGANAYLPGETVTINAGTRSDYEFDGWTIELGTVTLGSAALATTTFTMPSEDIIVRANWIEIDVPDPDVPDPDVPDPDVPDPDVPDPDVPDPDVPDPDVPDPDVPDPDVPDPVVPGPGGPESNTPSSPLPSSFDGGGAGLVVAACALMLGAACITLGARKRQRR